jgi:hypothetical protein
VDKIGVQEAIDHDRRRFFGAAALTFTAAELGVIGAANAETNAAPQPVIKLSINEAFAPLKQIDAGVLNVGYVEAGPPNGPPVLLLHGWPYDIHDYVEVAPILAAQGYRVIVSHLRGHGSTHFLDPATPRAGQQAAIGVDVIDLMDALKIRTAVLAGYDWGGRAAGLDFISRRSARAPGWRPIEMVSRAYCGLTKIPHGTTTMRTFSEALLRSTTLIMSTS